ncbi:MAG: signal protein PDZ, partial [Actinobacteria bacterium]|nr:signal protein PDZ [Actinomycetota bacterium]NIS33454.1 signal protein PDZ [Actinomycetota bacterium]NIW30168.1 signal protein PDZ [Actinomycetota bacterium]
MPVGDSRLLVVGEPLVLAGHGGAGGAISTQLIGRREFAGYWEYVLDEALFTSPAHPNWGGTALIDRSGQLCGI